MAFGKKVNEWSVLRWLLVAFCSSTTLVIGILDYPADTSLWTAVTLDPNGWWHETLLIWLGFIVMLDLTYHWEKKSKKFYLVRRIRTDYGRV